MAFKELLKDYFMNSTFHGFKFIVDNTYHISERIFWLACLIISWIASSMLISASLNQFRNNAISFVVETSYRDWKTNFPAIVICENKNMDRVQETSEILWGADHDFTLEEVLSEITYFRGESYHTVNECGQPDHDPNCITGNFSYYANFVRNDCEHTVDKCMWNGVAFKCCDYFHPMETEIGGCYALNSIQTTNSTGKRMNLISDRFSGPGVLDMEVLSEAYVSFVIVNLMK